MAREVSGARAGTRTKKAPESSRFPNRFRPAHLCFLFVRDDGALPVTERAETAFAVDEEVDLSVHTKVR
jgi:hypothetical protein